MHHAPDTPVIPRDRGCSPEASMTTDNGRAFNEWLRAQLKAKKMSQRQLAQQSGVDHSTISRLIRGDRMPSLGTATKLARGLREIRDDADTSTALGVVSVGPQNPTARVEYALRADEALSEPQVRRRYRWQAWGPRGPPASALRPPGPWPSRQDARPGLPPRTWSPQRNARPRWPVKLLRRPSRVRRCSRSGTVRPGSEQSLLCSAVVPWSVPSAVHL